MRTIENNKAAVDKFEGKISRTTTNTGSQKRSRELLNVGVASLSFERYVAA
jgi:hypothetical protein